MTNLNDLMNKREIIHARQRLESWQKYIDIGNRNGMTAAFPDAVDALDIALRIIDLQAAELAAVTAERDGLQDRVTALTPAPLVLGAADDQSELKFIVNGLGDKFAMIKALRAATHCGLHEALKWLEDNKFVLPAIKPASEPSAAPAASDTEWHVEPPLFASHHNVHGAYIGHDNRLRYASEYPAPHKHIWKAIWAEGDIAMFEMCAVCGKEKTS